MKRLSEAGIRTGTALMPILPFITDSNENLRTIVKKTKESYGQFVLAGGLVLADKQAEAFYNSLEKYDRNLIKKYKDLYEGNFSPQDNSWAIVGRKVKSLCSEYGLKYRIKRYIPETPLAINKRVAEQLFLKVYEMELNEHNEEEINKWRRLAFLIDEYPKPIINILSRQYLNALLNINEEPNLERNFIPETREMLLKNS
ncbi:MAG: hypothetical protein AABY07_06245 [Nanoarchaeota archaeon]